MSFRGAANGVGFKVRTGHREHGNQSKTNVDGCVLCQRALTVQRCWRV